MTEKPSKHYCALYPNLLAAKLRPSVASSRNICMLSIYIGFPAGINYGLNTGSSDSYSINPLSNLSNATPYFWSIL